MEGALLRIGNKVLLIFLFKHSESTNHFNFRSPGRFGANAKVVHFLGRIKPWNYAYDPKTKSVKSESHDPTMIHPQFLNLWWDIFATSVLPLLQEFGLVKDTHSYLNVVGSVFSFQITNAVFLKSWYTGRWSISWYFKQRDK